MIKKRYLYHLQHQSFRFYLSVYSRDPDPVENLVVVVVVVVDLAFDDFAPFSSFCHFHDYFSSRHYLQFSSVESYSVIIGS